MVYFTDNQNKHCLTAPVGIRNFILFMIFLAFLLINMPWENFFRADTVIMQYSGWVLIAIPLLAVALSGRIVFYRSFLLFLAFFILSLPLFWLLRDADIWSAASRVLLMWCGGLLLLWIAAGHLSSVESSLFADALIFTGMVCAVSVFVIILWPSGYLHWRPLPADMRASGGLRQVNVMASFLTTILVLTLHRWLFTGRFPFLICLVLLMVALTWTQSTIGMLGVIVVVSLMVLSCAGSVRPRLFYTLIVLVASWAVARFVLQVLQVAPLVDHDNSWAARIQMWRAGGRLIAQYPLTGQGYGMFEGVWPKGIAALHEVQQTALLNHPHNELLYWTIEGGLVTATGLALMITWGVITAVRLWRQASRAGGYGRPGSDALGWGLCALPILLHTQTEFPWYQSPVHYVLFIFLVGMALSGTETLPVMGLSGWLSQITAGIMALTGVALVYFALSGTVIRLSMDMAKQTMASDTSFFNSVRRINPWFQPDQQGFVANLHDLQQFNTDHDPARLRRASDFFRDYLLRHPDPNVYAMYLQVLSLQGRTTEAQSVYDEAHWRVGWDLRFAGGK
ncbi:PglL family O-oligosaccharyltransferase [Enterobacter hormaechei]|uniref:PglL family O-oligosaccharyltransferase n=1 Tax=Enterobacter hormaechei TaxID=158836 RepID=UPI0032D9E127